jgi:hypothetical protein
VCESGYFRQTDNASTRSSLLSHSRREKLVERLPGPIAPAFFELFAQVRSYVTLFCRLKESDGLSSRIAKLGELTGLFKLARYRSVQNDDAHMEFLSRVAEKWQHNHERPHVRQIVKTFTRRSASMTSYSTAKGNAAYDRTVSKSDWPT